jgi:CDP-glucose 4,6-dehydratase
LEGVVMAVNPDFWRGKKVLITGHTGFKGAWLMLWLERMGAQVSGLALPAATHPNLHGMVSAHVVARSHMVDVRDLARVKSVLQAEQPEVVFHLAAQALVRAGYADPLGTFSSNVLGTAHVLEAVRATASVKVVVAVTTDKVYQNNEWTYPYRETDPLGGHDPYSASKAAAELVISSYRASFLDERGTAVGSARAGNVMGGGDWSADRLIPDAFRAWDTDLPLTIRRPDAVRPWQHVLEPLAAYLVMAQHLWSSPNLAGAYNFGPSADSAATVRHVIELARSAAGRGGVNYDNEASGPHEAGLLKLDTSKAQTVFGVRARWSLAQAVQRTVQWYAQCAQGVSAWDLCHADIDAFEVAA